MLVGMGVGITAVAQPVINSFSPASGPVGTAVTISGQNFGSTSAANIVFFGATRATVINATSTAITVTVPVGATYQPISVTVNRLSGFSAQPFLVTFPGGQSIYRDPVSNVQNAFEPEIDSTTNLHPNGVAIADFDGDGKADVATPDNFSTTGQPASVSVLRNTSSVDAISFALAMEIPTGVFTYAVAAGDLDGDGRPDLVSSSVTDETISVFRNTSTVGSISFASKIDYPAGTNPFSIVITDIDLDGRPDIVVANYLDGSFSVFRNTSSNGTISFAPRVDFAAGLGCQQVVTGDLDGDGKPDVVVINALSNTVSIFRNLSTPGAVSFAPKSDLSIAISPCGLALGDLDGDEKPDLIIGGNDEFNAGSVLSYRNTSSPGSISFANAVNTSSGTTLTSIGLGDINGDGKQDLLVPGNNFDLFQNQSTIGNIAYVGGQILTPSNFIGYRPGFGDLDGDGKADLISPAFTYSVVAIYRNKSNEPTIYSFNPTNAVAGATVTISGAGMDSVTGVSFGNVPAASFTIVNSGTVTAVVGPGNTGNVAVSNRFGTNRLAGFVFDGPPVLTAFTPDSAAAGDTIYLSGRNFTNATGVSFGAAAAASFKILSDSTMIAVVGTGASGNVQVSDAYGTATLPGFSFIPPPSIVSFTPSGGGPGTIVSITGTGLGGATAVSIGGEPAASYTVVSPTTITAVVASGAFGSIEVITPGGAAISDSVFSFPPPVIGNIMPASAAVGSLVTINGQNFNTDPTKDIVYFGAAKAVVTAATTTALTVTVPPGATYSAVSLSVNNLQAETMLPFIATFPPGAANFTQNSFSWAGIFGTNGEPGNVVLADMDGDGKNDMVSLVGGQVTVLYNSSRPNRIAFTAVPNLVEGQADDDAYFVMLVGDFNCDGKPDILITDNQYYSIFLNTSTIGHVSFAPRVDFSISGQIYSVAVADLDGDGRPDLAFTSSDSNGLSFCRNIGENGQLAFERVLSMPEAINGTNTVRTADVDGDGKPDIVFTSENGSVIFRNVSSVGNFSFDSALAIPALTSPNVLFADMDGDGKLDILQSGQAVSVFTNTSTSGEISFGPPSSFGVPLSGVSVMGQLDGDGKPDFFTYPSASSPQVAFSRNTSVGGSYSVSAGVLEYLQQLTFYYSRGACIGDLDGDGKPDVAIAEIYDNAMTVFRNQIGDSVISVCANTDTSFAAPNTGSTYQWQVGGPNGYVNLSDDSTYSGTTSATLTLKAIPDSLNASQIRCLVDGSPLTVIDLTVMPAVMPLATLSAPATVCADSGFIVVFTPVGSVPVNSAIRLFSSKDGGDFLPLSTQTFNGQLITFSLVDSTGSSDSYFCSITPPSGAGGCMVGSATDTVKLSVIHTQTPVVQNLGQTLTVTNADSAATYIWQKLDGGQWVGFGSGFEVSTDSLSSIGAYRVMEDLSNCTSISNPIIYFNVVSTTNSPGDDIHYFPNPAFNSLTIDSLDLSAGWQTLEIVNASNGVRLAIYSISGVASITIGVANLPQGLYLAVLRRKSGSPVILKFIRL
jgi:hypothetical protein